MGFKCAPQIIGLTQGEPKHGKAGAKHRANGEKLLKEMGEERASLSKTLDKTLSGENRYLLDDTSHSGEEVWDSMTELAHQHGTKYKDKKTGETKTRALRKDTVIGYAMIINPPSEVCEDWTDEQYEQFYQDTLDIMEDLCPEIFREENYTMAVEHRDEDKDQANTYHLHIAGLCLDEQGKFCGNLIDGKFLAMVNQEYPKRMREKGWDMDDLDTTDWERYDTDPEYRALQKDKAKDHGQNTNTYARAQQTLQNAINREKLAKLDQDIAKKERERAEQERQQAEDERKRADKALSEAQRERQEQHELLDEVQTMHEDTVKAYKDAKADRETARSYRDLFYDYFKKARDLVERLTGTVKKQLSINVDNLEGEAQDQLADASSYLDEWDDKNTYPDN